MATLWPFFTFYGGKWRVAPRYPAPKHDTVIEPFAGSAGYALRHHGRNVLLLDRDPAVVATWQYLLRVSESEVLSLPDIADGQSVDELPICMEARMLIGRWLNKGTASPCKRPSKWMVDRLRPNSFWGTRVRERIASQLAAVRHWRVMEGTYESAPHLCATWFVDPPYRRSGKHYRFNNAQIDYTALAAWCQTLIGQVMVCEQSGADWLPFQPFCTIKASEARHGGKQSQEVLWYRDDSSGL